MPSEEQMVRMLEQALKGGLQPDFSKMQQYHILKERYDALKKEHHFEAGMVARFKPKLCPVNLSEDFLCIIDTMLSEDDPVDREYILATAKQQTFRANCRINIIVGSKTVTLPMHTKFLYPFVAEVI